MAPGFGVNPALQFYPGQRADSTMNNSVLWCVKMRSMSGGQPQDLTGKIYGRLSVCWPVGRKGANIHWLCLCKCGALKTFAASNLRGGHSLSCGCLKREKLPFIALRHGMRHTPEYEIYKSAKQRCVNPKNKRWKDYGGRGIKFRFANFQDFFKEIGPRPPRHVLGIGSTTMETMNLEISDGRRMPNQGKTVAHSQKKLAKISGKAL
jgi:hypothetical protein